MFACSVFVIDAYAGTIIGWECSIQLATWLTDAWTLPLVGVPTCHVPASSR